MARKSKSGGIKAVQLGSEISKMLELYADDVAEAVNVAGEKAVREMVKQTKSTAPEMTGSFKRHIAMKAVPQPHGMKSFVWHVKAPDYRLTHLLAKGHATVNGGRVPGHPFLKNAVDSVLPEYEKAVEEAIKKC